MVDVWDIQPRVGDYIDYYFADNITVEDNSVTCSECGDNLFDGGFQTLKVDENYTSCSNNHTVGRSQMHDFGDHIVIGIINVVERTARRNPLIDKLRKMKEAIANIRFDDAIILDSNIEYMQANWIDILRMHYGDIPGLIEVNEIL